MHDVARAPLNIPIGQGLHAVAFVFLLAKVPAVQGVQLEDPGEPLNLPVGQGSHDPALSPLNVPPGHPAQYAEPSSLANLPASHRKQLLDPTL